MFIVPITAVNTLDDLNKAAASQTTSGALPFASVFQDAINNVSQTNSDFNTELTKIATGQSDDLHNLSIASQKASLSVQLLVEMRDKAMDAYNEVMRMNV